MEALMARAIQKPEGQSDDHIRDQTVAASGTQAGLGSFWRAATFEELAATQGVRPVGKSEEIMGGWPEDHLDDGFEDAIRAMRQEDLRQERGQ
jgi:hypothetical protein